MSATRSEKRSRRQLEADTPALEWLLGAIGAVLFASAVGFLAYEGLSQEELPGAVTASVLQVVEVEGGYVATFSLHNAGGETLSNLNVTGRLLAGDEEIERARTVIDYLPRRSTREGGFYFRNDPANARLEITPEGYQTP